ncbi:TadE-like protein [Butyrivibrio fibrisolvens DSM 3071]|uniref:TadE-like protein n=1 Tax=Butyrivibrio fibrisolvens DSM 3071 TaxID=1121131 RepID=A0A1M5ZP06_BUTFI|nr:TadE-like protein [Butyrivibrio fibrisolvens DSM 3071]
MHFAVSDLYQNIEAKILRKKITDRKDSSQKISKIQNAYLTVELALIFPVILLVIVLVVHWGFMMYDRVIMSQDAYLLALRGAVISDEEPEQYALENSDWQFGAWYFGSPKPTVQTSSDWLLNTVEVTLSMETYHGGTSYYSINPQGKWASSISWKADYTRPSKRVRLFTRAYDLYKVLTSE